MKRKEVINYEVLAIPSVNICRTHAHYASYRQKVVVEVSHLQQGAFAKL